MTGLSVILPAYNEEDRIEATVREVADYLAGRRIDHEILVVDDGSSDSTGARVTALCRAVPSLRLVAHPSNRGKGMAVKTGVEHATKPYCLFMDADNSTSIREWSRCEAALAAGARAVIGSRRVPGARIVHPQPPLRRLLGGGYRWICRRLFGMKTRDFNCGFKAYETALAREVYAELVMSDWSFDVEVLVRLKRRGVEPVEVPVQWSHAEKPSNLAPVRSALTTLGSLALLCRVLRPPRK